MSYNKIGFAEGQILKAEHLNHMEDGIANAGGGSGVSSWNDLTDKPFGETVYRTIVWDGNIDGKEMVKMNSKTQAVLVSEEYFTANQLIGGSYTVGNDVFDIIETDIMENNGAAIHNYFVSVSAPMGPFTIPGTYFAYINDGETFVSELTVKKVEKINEKYLPYVAITRDLWDNSYSCNISDILTLVEQLTAYPLIFYRELDADSSKVVFQILMCGYWLNYDDNGEIASVSLLNQRGNEALRFWPDGTVTPVEVE